MEFDPSRIRFSLALVIASWLGLWAFARGDASHEERADVHIEEPIVDTRDKVWAGVQPNVQSVKT